MTNTFYVALHPNLHKLFERSQAIEADWFGGCVPLKRDYKAAMEAYIETGNPGTVYVIELNITDAIVTSWVMSFNVQTTPWLRGWRVFADIRIDHTNVLLSNTHEDHTDKDHTDPLAFHHNSARNRIDDHVGRHEEHRRCNKARWVR